MGATMLYLLSYCGSAIAALAITPLSGRVARAMGVVDVPNARKVHQEPIPRAGGVAIFLALTLIGLPALALLARGHSFGGFSAQLISMWIAGAFLLVVGLIDDVFEISSKLKLLA